MIKYILPITFILSGCMGEDKAYHAVAGVAISSIVYDQTGSRLAGCGAALAAGLAKEAIDSRTHKADPYDVFATTAGCSLTFVF